jgi:hypothetical protein
MCICVDGTQLGPLATLLGLTLRPVVVPAPRGRGPTVPVLRPAPRYRAPLGGTATPTAQCRACRAQVRCGLCAGLVSKSMCLVHSLPSSLPAPVRHPRRWHLRRDGWPVNASMLGCLRSRQLQCSRVHSVLPVCCWFLLEHRCRCCLHLLSSWYIRHPWGQLVRVQWGMQPRERQILPGRGDHQCSGAVPRGHLVGWR